MMPTAKWVSKHQSMGYIARKQQKDNALLGSCIQRKPIGMFQTNSRP